MAYDLFTRRQQRGRSYARDDLGIEVMLPPAQEGRIFAKVDDLRRDVRAMDTRQLS